MPEAARNAQHGFWRPPISAEAMERSASDSFSQPINCPECGNEFVVGARFCHLCGSQREPQVSSRPGMLSRLLDFDHIRQWLGLSVASLVAFIFGLGCVVAAIATGFIYSATTLLDWQAVQVWRIEWLLAAAAAFLAAILLKKPN